jgi:hypothetical protein
MQNTSRSNDKLKQINRPVRLLTRRGLFQDSYSAQNFIIQCMKPCVSIE